MIGDIEGLPGLDEHNPVCRLIAAAEVLKKHAPRHIARWFEVAVLNFIDPTKQECSLDVGLLLGADGNGRKPRTVYFTALRDFYLHAAWGCCLGDSDWARVEDLARVIKRFQSNAWANSRHEDTPNPGWSDSYKALFWAFRCGLDVPQSPRRLYDILKRVR